MKRIMIIGQPGAGKSTLAIALARVTGLPIVHMDRIHYQAGWVPRTYDDELTLTIEAMRKCMDI